MRLLKHTIIYRHSSALPKKTFRHVLVIPGIANRHVSYFHRKRPGIGFGVPGTAENVSAYFLVISGNAEGVTAISHSHWRERLQECPQFYCTAKKPSRNIALSPWCSQLRQNTFPRSTLNFFVLPSPCIQPCSRPLSVFCNGFGPFCQAFAHMSLVFVSTTCALTNRPYLDGISCLSPSLPLTRPPFGPDLGPPELGDSHLQETRNKEVTHRNGHRKFGRSSSAGSATPNPAPYVEAPPNHHSWRKRSF